MNDEFYSYPDWHCARCGASSSLQGHRISSGWYCDLTKPGAQEAAKLYDEESARLRAKREDSERLELNTHRE